jgi:hypothetical protein
MTKINLLSFQETSKKLPRKGSYYPRNHPRKDGSINEEESEYHAKPHG